MYPKPVVFVVDDDHGVCQSLRWLLESVKLKVECFTDPSSFLATYNPNLCGCIVADVRMPVMSGMEMLEQLNARQNRLPVIMITGYGDIPMAVRAIKTGAVEYIVKPFNEQYFLSTVQKYITLNINECALEPFEDYAKFYKTLSQREQQVMHLVVKGKLNKQIANDLNISNSTVEFHRARVMKKMHAKNLTHLVEVCLKLQNIDKTT